MAEAKFNRKQPSRGGAGLRTGPGSAVSFNAALSRYRMRLHRLDACASSDAGG
jgi:hypothetical protein